jgi:LacI family transcriptional regulator
MGYRINPLVAALMRARRTGSAVKHVVIAYITNYPTRYGWRAPYHDRPDYFPGAQERAQEFGYKLEHFWLAEPGMTPERFSEILKARSIHGAVIGRLPPGQEELRLKWEGFSCVALGQTLHAPALHRVAEDHFWAAWAAMDSLLNRGYRRIGFVFSEADDSPRVGERWLGAFLRQQLRCDVSDRLPPLLFEAQANNAERFSTWLKQTRPDALLVTHAAPVLAWLEALQKSVPKHLGLATLVNDHPERGWTGIHCDPNKLGALAVEMLIGLMHRAEVGIPSDPHEVLLRGEWLDGQTAPAKLAQS